MSNFETQISDIVWVRENCCQINLHCRIVFVCHASEIINSKLIDASLKNTTNWLTNILVSKDLPLRERLIKISTIQ